MKSSANATPSLSKVPFSVNVTSPEPCRIRLSVDVNEPFVVVRV